MTFSKLGNFQMSFKRLTTNRVAATISLIWLKCALSEALLQTQTIQVKRKLSEVQEPQKSWFLKRLPHITNDFVFPHPHKWRHVRSKQLLPYRVANCCRSSDSRLCIGCRRLRWRHYCTVLEQSKRWPGGREAGTFWLRVFTENTRETK